MITISTAQSRSRSPALAALTGEAGAAADTAAAGPPATRPPPVTAAPAPTTAAGSDIPLTWYLGGVIVLMILGFVGGAIWMDRRSVRRHGGFRI